MLRYCFGRLVSLIPIAIGVVTLVALMARVVPGDPVDTILSEYATKEDKDELRAQLGLDKPALTQLFDYYGQLLKGDLGTSLIKRKPVNGLIAERIWPTTQLAVFAIIVAILIALPLGILSALFAGKILDYVAMGFALLGIAVPNFWLGSMLVLVFAIELDVLPVSERTDWRSYILPAFTMGIALAAILTRMTRNSMLDTFKEDFVRTARAKGNNEFVVVAKHVLRNAALPLVTILGLQFGVILTGAVITESIFDWPGLGTLVLEAVKSRDYPVIQGCVLMFSATYLVVNLATDLAYALIDPRIKIAN
jgi:peptide/nickel transport system permease protein